MSGATTLHEMFMSPLGIFTLAIQRPFEVMVMVIAWVHFIRSV